MNIDEVFASKWLKAADLKERDHTVTIAAAEPQKMPNENKTKIALYFTGKEKGLLLNVTNAKRIAQMFGKETDKWIGKQVVIFPTQVEFSGDMVAAIRVKGVLPQRQEGKEFGPQVFHQTVRESDGPPPGHPAAEPPRRTSFDLEGDEVPF